MAEPAYLVFETGGTETCGRWPSSHTQSHPATQPVFNNFVTLDTL